MRRLGEWRAAVLGPMSGGRGAMALPPERVRVAIRRSDEQSEVLICLVQIVAIVGFALLYTLSPKAFGMEVMFQPVPVALAAYSLFTGVRLWLALRRRLGAWFLTLSVIVDMAVLMVTIWSFHLQYAAPPGLSLKAPTLMYAFILIALRALRFESRYVLLAGAAAVAGWLVIVAHAVWSAAPGSMSVTRSFAEYASSNRILIGAEIDKIVSLSAVALILAAAVTRARRVLLDATVERQAGAELARFFDPAVASRIRDSAMAIRPGQGVAREASILTTDLRGFTRFAAAASPDATIAILAEYQALLVPLIQRNGGSIDKYLGDGILASFGAVEPSDRHAADALRAADAVREAAAGWADRRRSAGEEPIAVGCAVAAGPVVLGAIGDVSRLEYTVIGEPVNLAAKLEKHTKREMVTALTTAETLRVAREQGYAGTWTILPQRAVDGVGERLDLATPASPTAGQSSGPYSSA